MLYVVSERAVIGNETSENSTQKVVNVVIRFPLIFASSLFSVQSDTNW